MAVQITLSDLTAKVQQGWKKPALAEYYGLPVAQMGRVLKDANLTIRKFHAPKYELIHDDVDLITDTTMNMSVAQPVIFERPTVVGMDLTDSMNTPVRMEARTGDVVNAEGQIMGGPIIYGTPDSPDLDFLDTISETNQFLPSETLQAVEAFDAAFEDEVEALEETETTDTAASW